MNLHTINRRVDSLHMVPERHSEGSSIHRSIPSLALTKGELAALYETAVKQGNTIRLDPGNGNIIHAAVHEIDADNEKVPTNLQQEAEPPGYYYYYYPLKSFMDEMTSGTHEVSTFVLIFQIKSNYLINSKNHKFIDLSMKFSVPV